MSLSEALATLPLKMLLAAGFATYLVRCVCTKRAEGVPLLNVSCDRKSWPALKNCDGCASSCAVLSRM